MVIKIIGRTLFMVILNISTYRLLEIQNLSLELEFSFSILLRRNKLGSSRLKQKLPRYNVTINIARLTKNLDFSSFLLFHLYHFFDFFSFSFFS